MKNTLAIAKKELLSYFISPIAYIIIFSFLIISGIFFVTNTISVHVAEMKYVFSNLVIIIFFMCPIMTMRLIAEEKKNGTLELLLTSPIKTSQIILGKYIAVLGLYFIILLITLLYPAFLELKASVSWGLLFYQYLGIFLLGATVLGIGLVSSAITENQIVAGILGVSLSLGLFLLSWVSGETSGILRNILDEITIVSHYQSFLKGIIDFKDIIYYFVFIIFTIFLSIKIVESNRWRK